MHTKIAQFRLTNAENIQPFRMNRRGNRHIMPDVAFERFLMSMKKVHEAIASGTSYDGAKTFFTTGITRRAGQEIIEQIGLESFVKMPWNSIESVLRFYRTGEGTLEELPEGQQEVSEEVPAAPQEEIAPIPGQIELIPTGEYQGLTREQMDKVEEYKAKEYGSSEVMEQNVKKMLNRMIGGFRKLNDPNASDFEKNLAMSSHIEVAMEILDQWHEEFLNKPQEVEESEEKEEVLEEIEEEHPKESVSVKIEVGEKDKALASVENDAREQGVKKTYPSEATDEEALEATGLHALADNDYFSVEDGNLIVHEDAFQKAYEHTQELFRKWADQAIRSEGGVYKPPAPEVANQLNIIVHGVRVFDYGVFSKFAEYILELDKAIDSAESKEQQKNLILLKKKLLRQKGTKLERNFISFKLSQDKIFAESISLPILYTASFPAFVNMTFAREKFINRKNSKLADSIKSDPEAAQTFINSLNKRSITGITYSFRKFWRLDIRDLNPDTSRDILEFMKISALVYFTGAVSDANSRQKGLKSFNTTNCPTCHKVIELHVGSSTTREEDYNGFDVGIYAPYSKTEGGFVLLAEEDFRYTENGEEKRFAPPGEDYIKQTRPGQVTLEVINAMDDSFKTWDEINSMVNSESFEIQREGIIRRSAAFRQMGASFKNTTNINSKKFLCPMGKHKTQFDTNICGLKMKAPEGVSRGYHLQPTWNGQLPEIVTNNGKLLKQYENDYFTPEGWEDEELAQLAAAKGKGGYKFSKVMFGCPCHIHSPDPSDKDLWMKYSNVAFRLKDDFFPPTKPNGSLADIDPETRAYLVCSSNVSLSSVDRDPSSPTFVLNYLKELHNSKSELFITLIDFLATNGFDEVDLLQMIEDISSPNILSKTSKLSRRISERISKLEDILIKNAITIGMTSTIIAIKDLTLVCPFGHKFTIEQSLKFGESHGSFKLNNSNAYKQVSSLIGTVSGDNKAAFKEFLVPYDDLGTQKAAYYDEWIKLPLKKRKINFWKQTSSEVVLLKFNIDGEDYVFNNKVAVRQRPIWSGSATRNFDTSQIDRQIYNEGMRISGTFGTQDAEGNALGGIENIGQEAGRIQDAGDAYEEARTEWEMVMSQILDYDIEEESHKFSPPPPSGFRSYSGPNSLITNMNALSRALSGAFNIMNIWTTNLIHENLGESFARQYLEEEQLREMSDIVFDQFVRANIDFDYYGEEEGSEQHEQELQEALSAAKSFFGDIFVDNSQISSLIRRGDLSESEVAQKIIHDAILDFAGKIENIRGISQDLVIDFQIDPQNVAAAASKLTRYEVAPAKNRFSQPETLGQKITIFDKKTATKDVQGFGKLTLVAYARYIANTLYKMQSLFFTKSSPLYTGYNPLMETYSSPEDILKVSKEDVAKINVIWGTKNSLPESPYTIYDSPAEVDEFGPKYQAMVNKAYHYLDLHIKNARSLVITPKSIQAAKQYIQEEMTDRYLAEFLKQNPEASTEDARKAVRRRQSLVERSLPIYNSDFDNLIGAYEREEVVLPDGKTKIVSRYSPYNVFPYFPLSKQKKSSDLSHPFYSQLQIETDPETGRKVLTDPERGYNSGQIQVGAITRPTIRQWPMPKFGFYGDKSAGKRGTTTKNHVGLPLPFYGNYRANQVSELRDLLVFNLKPVVELPIQVSDEEGGVSISSAKVDISFLLERGFSKEHYRMIYNLYDELSQIKSIYKEELDRIESIEDVNPGIIENLERQIQGKRTAIERNQNRPGFQNKVLIDQRELGALEAKAQRYIDELENVDQLKQRLESWYSSNIKRIQNEFASLPVNVNTKKDFYHMKDQSSNLDELEDGPFAGHRKNVGKMMPAGVLHVGLTDPILAYKLIMNPEFHGANYISLGEERIPSEETRVKNALIDFIVGVYNLDQIARFFAKKNAKFLKMKGIDLFTFNGRELLKRTAEGEFDADEISPISYSTKDFMPGNYYNVSTEDSSISLYSATDPDTIPTYSELQFAAKKAKVQGLARPFESRSESNNLVTVSHRAAEAMSRYIETMAKGDLPEQDEDQARDQVLASSSKLYGKFLKRAESLQRIIMVQAASIIDPANIL